MREYKNYKYIFAVSGLILGAIIGYLIGWVVNMGLFFVFSKIGGIGGTGIMAYIGLFIGFLPIVIIYGFPIIGAIRGWEKGCKIGKKKDEK